MLKISTSDIILASNRLYLHRTMFSSRAALLATANIRRPALHLGLDGLTYPFLGDVDGKPTTVAVYKVDICLFPISAQLLSPAHHRLAPFKGELSASTTGPGVSIDVLLSSFQLRVSPTSSIAGRAQILRQISIRLLFLTRVVASRVSNRCTQPGSSLFRWPCYAD